MGQRQAEADAFVEAVKRPDDADAFDAWCDAFAAAYGLDPKHWFLVHLRSRLMEHARHTTPPDEYE